MKPNIYSPEQAKSPRTSCTPRRGHASLLFLACTAAAAAAVMVAPNPAKAATQTFTYPGGGLWNIYGNWDDGFGPVPVNGDDAVIGINGSVTFNFSYASPGLNSLTLDSSGGTATLDQGTGTAMITAGSETIGGSGGGYYDQTGGSNSALSFVIIGDNFGGVGLYAISDGTFNSSSQIFVGNSGNGTLDVSGAGAVSASGLDVGNANGSNSIAQAAQNTNNVVYNVNISGASLSTSGSQYVGFGGFGAVNQTGGSNTITSNIYNNLYIGYSLTGLGLYNISGGTFSNSSGGYIEVGDLGNGTLDISGTGTVDTSGLSVGIADGGNAMAQASQVSAAPVYNVNISGGSLNISGYQFIGLAGFGAVSQTGGNSATTLDANIGDKSTGVGIYSISGGAFSTGGYLFIGAFGNGTFNISGTGTVRVANLYVGLYLNSNSVAQASQGGTDPVYNLSISGGSLSTTNNQTIGNFGFGAADQTGGSNTIGGTLTLAANAGSSSVYTLDGGSLVATAIVLNTNGFFDQNNGTRGEPNNGTLNVSRFNQSGGTVNGTLQNQGTFNYESGLFNARLINQGSLALVNTNLFIAANGIENDSTLNVALGQTITVNGQGLNNQASLTIQGGTINGSGVLANNGQINMFGTIGGTGGLVNNGNLGISYSATDTQIVLANTGSNTNNGAIQLAQGYSLSLAGNAIALANAGTITLGGGAVNGAGTLNNNSGGTIQGPGVISATLNNTGGEIDATSGTLTLTNLQGNTNGGELLINDNSEINSPLAFLSSGEIVLAGNNAVIAGGAINNSGTISGFGRVGNAVSNLGTIRADGGTLTFTGSLITNSAAGNIEAGTGDTTFFSQGLADNSGTIALSGGTFDNNNNPMQISATGYLLGNGTVRTGGLTNLNSVSMADGATAFYGPVTNGYTGAAPANAPAPTIQITSNTTTFYGPVTNETGGLIISTGAVIRYLGAFVNNGTAISDPSTTTFTTLTEGTTGITELSAGDEYKVLLNFYNNSTENAQWNTSNGTLELTGNAHSMTVAGGDLGATASGYTHNFAWGQFILDSGGSLSLGKGTGLAAGMHGAFYTEELLLAGGTSQIANITGNGVSIYYDPNNSANAYLDGRTYALTNGGFVAPTPEPTSLALLATAGGGMLLLGKRRRV